MKKPEYQNKFFSYYFIILVCSLVIFLSSSSQASTLYKVRFGDFQDKLRVVFEFNGSFSYEPNEKTSEIKIWFSEAKAGEAINNYNEINDIVVRNIILEPQEGGMIATIPLTEPVQYTIFHLNNPPRLVVDFDHSFLRISTVKTITPGLDYLEIRKGNNSGLIKGTALKLDLEKMTIRPALGQKDEPNIVASFLGLFSPWGQDNQPRNFYLERVSETSRREKALAAVNGSFFQPNGTPLGALVIDQTVVSSPIYDRSAIFIDKDNQPYIDSVSVSSYFLLDEKRYNISEINCPQTGAGIIMYTPVWGEKTRTNTFGLELAITNSHIKAINTGNSDIPSNGYVLSIRGPALENINYLAKVGDEISTIVNIIPYNSSPKNIIQLISGGPRLLKDSQPYVSKHEEKFQGDVAKNRAARTAVGITKENKLLLVTIDGLPRHRRVDKTSDSIGATLEELSSLMLSLGATNAMNLDGGSSSTMVINHKIVNQPCTGWERKVSNSLLVLPRAR